MTSVDWTSAPGIPAHGMPAPGRSKPVTPMPVTSSSDVLCEGANDPDWRPALVRAVVLRTDRVRGADLLVMPERVVVLNGRAASIVRLCDGTRTVQGIIDELSQDCPGAPPAADVPAFIDRLRTEGWLG